VRRVLVGMEFHPQPGRGRRFEEARDLGGGEGDGFAEGVDRVGEALGAGLGQEFGEHRVDIGVGAGGLGGQGMGGEQAGDDAHAAMMAKCAGDVQLAELGWGIEAVAGFDFDGGDTLGEHGV
jgi:hypothetical protein